MEYWAAIKTFLTDNAVILGSLAAITAILGVFTGGFKSIFIRSNKPQKVQMVEPETPPDQTANPRLDVVSFLSIQKRIRADLKKELETAHIKERDILLEKIETLNAIIENPDDALKKAQDTIARLETALSRESNQISAQRLTKARAALEAGDYSLADDIFAEIENRNELEIQSTARAAYGRGEIAEAEIRWHDAANHYAKAARLDPTYDHLIKAGEFLHHAGQYQQALRVQQELVELAKREFGGADQKTTAALNNLATSLHALGDLDAAEPLMRQAMQINKNALGKEHMSYAIDLNNLATLLQDKGDLDAAEPLMRQAMQIDRNALGKDHTSYARDINNLAVLLQAKGDLDGAEPLMRQAMQIDKNALGKDHTSYATHLNNLATLLQAKGDLDAAEPLMRQAMQINKNALGKEHASYARDLNNLAVLLQAKGDLDGAEPLMRQAMQIDKNALGKDHTSYARDINNLALLLQAKGDLGAAEPLMRQAVDIFETALGVDHPNSKTVRANLERLLQDM